MILSDSVEIVTGDTVAGWTVAATLPAHVGYRGGETLTSDGRQGYVYRLEVIIPPFDFDPATHRIRWRNVVYQNDGPPMARRRYGRDHHLTIPAKQVTG